MPTALMATRTAPGATVCGSDGASSYRRSLMPCSTAAALLYAGAMCSLGSAGRGRALRQQSTGAIVNPVKPISTWSMLR